MRQLLNFLRVTSVIGLGAALFACSSYQYSNSASWSANHSLASQTNLVAFSSESAPQQLQNILGLKNTLYQLFFKQGIFAGQDKFGEAEYNYQRWQVPLVMGTLQTLNLDYSGQFHDFLPLMAQAQSARYGAYADFLQLLYQLNNWDVFSVAQQAQLCQKTSYCLLIDDRLWWVNELLSYSSGLRQQNSSDPVAQQLFDFAYKIFVEGISQPRYLNRLGTGDYMSVMWYSSSGEEPYYKATIANSLYVTAGARLAQQIMHYYGLQNESYDYALVLKNTQQVADGYFLGQGSQIKQHGMLLDGVGTGNALGISRGADFPSGQPVKRVFSYNQGVVLPGMVILTDLTGQSKYLKYAKSLISASMDYAAEHAGYFDDYGYSLPNGWQPDGDRLAFRLAYWHYFGLFLANYNLASDEAFARQIQRFVARNSAALSLRPIALPQARTVVNFTAPVTTLAAPNNNNLTMPSQGALFSNYPDGYSVPGIAAALELLVLEQRLNYSLSLQN